MLVSKMMSHVFRHDQCTVISPLTPGYRPVWHKRGLHGELLKTLISSRTKTDSEDLKKQRRLLQ